jgi:hypothetical protein
MAQNASKDSSPVQKTHNLDDDVDDSESMHSLAISSDNERPSQLDAMTRVAQGVNILTKNVI